MAQKLRMLMVVIFVSSVLFGCATKRHGGLLPLSSNEKQTCICQHSEVEPSKFTEFSKHDLGTVKLAGASIGAAASMARFVWGGGGDGAALRENRREIKRSYRRIRVTCPHD